MNKIRSSPTEKISPEMLASMVECTADFRQIIQERLGIIIHDHQIHQLHKTIVAACHQFNCLPNHYLQLLKTAADQSPILDHLIAGVTVGETYFFRDQNQMNLLQKTVLPDIIERKKKQGNLSLRIWSAGCASGEEIYTVAILLYELIPDINKWLLSLLGTDINTLALQKAIANHYNEWSMRSISDYFKTNYFHKNDQHFSLKSLVRNAVKFDYLNLNDDTYPSIFNGTNAQDLILCRNVLIYFDSNRIAKLMQKLTASLMPGGYLLLGASDPINIKETDLVFDLEKNIFCRPTSAPTPVPKQMIPPISLPLAKPAAPIWQKQILTPPKQTSVPTIDKQLITKLLNESQWQTVLDIINAENFPEQESAFIFLAKATALANMGELATAVMLLQKSLHLDPTNKFSHFIYALVLIELNQLQKAEAAFRKTLFLDRQFVVAHYQLGLLLLRNKEMTAGLRSLRNALAIAKNKDAAENVPESHGLTYGRFAEILGYEIILYSTTEKNNHAYENTTG